MREFLQSRVVNGGAIPKCSQLRDYYLFDVYQTERSNLKEIIKNKKVALIVDELSDDEGRYVLDVMAVLLDFDELSPHGNSVAYLLDTHFLNATNNRTVSQAVVKTVHEYGIDNDDVRVFNSDNVSYMMKAFCDTLSCLFPFCIHITTSLPQPHCKSCCFRFQEGFQRSDRVCEVFPQSLLRPKWKEKQIFEFPAKGPKSKGQCHYAT